MYAVEKKRAVLLVSKIEEKVIENLGIQLTNLYEESKEDWISFFIGSGGGLINITFGLYEYILKILKPKLQTISLGITSSIAPILFVAGEHRVVGEYSRFLFHHFGRSSDGGTRMDTNDFNREGEEFKVLEEIYIKILCERSGGKLTPRTLRRWIDAGETIGAKECVRYGLAHEILS